MTGEEATARGYRRVSNTYRTVARIDRADWLTVLAVHLMRAPADFIVRAGPDRGEVAPGWADHYRRCFSRDVITLPRKEFSKVPGSGWDPTGYVPPVKET